MTPPPQAEKGKIFSLTYPPPPQAAEGGKNLPFSLQNVVKCPKNRQFSVIFWQFFPKIAKNRDFWGVFLLKQLDLTELVVVR